MAFALPASADTAVGAFDTAEVEPPEPAGPPPAVAGAAATDDSRRPAVASVATANPPLRARIPTTSPLPGPLQYGSPTVRIGDRPTGPSRITRSAQLQPWTHGHQSCGVTARRRPPGW